MPAELRIGDSNYRVVRKLNAFQQVEVMSKASPLLSSGFGELAPLLVELRAEGLNLGDTNMGRLLQILTPIAKQLAGMTEKDRRDIIEPCLSCVDRQKTGEQGWARIWNSDAHILMFEDINYDAFLMLRIVLFVMAETFQSFLPAPLSNLLGQTQH